MRVLWGFLASGMMLAAAPAARSESDQFCFDQMRAIEAQLQRAQKAQCNFAGGIWTADMKEHFAFCRANDAGAIRYWHNQRESQLKYCEAPAVSGGSAQILRPDELRIRGGPGAYAIHWTIRTLPCPHNSGVDGHCFVQIRLEVPPGRAGGYAHQLRRYEEPASFTQVRDDPYPGQPGEVIILKYQACTKGGVTRAFCSGFVDLPLVMPPPVPEFKAARIVALDPPEWIPQRLRKGETQARVVTPGATTQLKVRLDGTRDAFTPTPFQDAKSWRPEVKFRLFSRGVLVTETQPMPFPPSGVGVFSVPLKALDGQQCGANVGVSNLCATLDVEVESFRRWTGGNVADLQESMGKSRKEPPLVTPMAAITAGQQLRNGPPPGMNLGGLREPATVTSKCGVTYRVGRIDFAARQGNVDRLTANTVPVELQYAGGQGLWGSSTLLTSLPAVPNTNPPEYRASLPVPDLLKSGASWRWRVRAVQDGKPGDWCAFAVAPAPGMADQKLRVVR